VGGKLNAKEFRAACRKYAQEQVDLQRTEFRRFGVLGDWNRPYMTMDPRYEGQQIRALGHIIRNGHLYKGAKPVYWCLDCRSSLAEAEVEYEDKTSPAVDVAFRVVDPAEFARRVGIDFDSIAAHPVSLVIWTTTPWTLPANEAVALGPNIEYVVLWVSRNRQSELLVLANELLDACLQALRPGPGPGAGAVHGQPARTPAARAPVPGETRAGDRGRSRDARGGTGAVHTAPAHGQDDFIVGVKYSLPVDNRSWVTAASARALPSSRESRVDDANEVLIKETGKPRPAAQARNHQAQLSALLAPQDAGDLPRHAAMVHQHGAEGPARTCAARHPEDAVGAGWGEQRIYGMIKDRPDWCLSRQRTWGVPIALVRAQGNPGTASTHAGVDRGSRQACRKDGIDAWFDLDAAELLGAEAESYEKVIDVMDVWADSGLSHECVAKTHPDEIRPPVELYLEGSDQHRGWFHSSLLMSEALYSRAPTRVLDARLHGRRTRPQAVEVAGNVIEPKKVMSTLGADVLRLWIAATDYSNEMALSDEILKRMSESYRRMRNTVRFLIGNLAGFDPAATRHPGEMVAIDRWALQRVPPRCTKKSRMRTQVQYHLIYQKIHNFCVVDLGGFYIDLLKDRLYTTPKKSHAPPLAQNRAVSHRREHGALAGAILSYTADEIWSSCPASAASRCSSRPGTNCQRVDRDRFRLEPADPAQGRGRTGTGEAARGRHHRRLARRRSRSLQQG
jgi:isoleucyl-tRNA synthetase